MKTKEHNIATRHGQMDSRSHSIGEQTLLTYPLLEGESEVSIWERLGCMASSVSFLCTLCASVIITGSGLMYTSNLTCLELSLSHVS
jgi:hypothetical protein